VPQATPADVADAIRVAAARSGHRPAVTVLRHGRRDEQGYASLARWAAKGAHLLEIECLLEPGERIRVGVGPDWTTAAVCYAVSNIFAATRFSRVSPFVVVTGSSVTGALMLTPLALFQLPSEMPSAKAASSVVALGVVGTAIALLFFYRMLNRYGASRAALVTYLIPLVAMVYGVTLLDEPVSANAVAGLVLILGGVAVGSGAIRFARRQVVPAAPRS
jgi:uncharacterized membrane protein